jgi:hypothetical protein
MEVAVVAGTSGIRVGVDLVSVQRIDDVCQRRGAGHFSPAEQFAAVFGPRPSDGREGQER